MNAVLVRILALLTGWICGNFMTAQIIVMKLTGKPAVRLGTTGNPGMANVMAHLGFKPGILTLAGDLGKTVVAMVLGGLLWHSGFAKNAMPGPAASAASHLSVLWSGTGAVLGHNFPLLFGLIMSLRYRKYVTDSSTDAVSEKNAGQPGETGSRGNLPGICLTRSDLHSFYHGGKGVAATCIAIFGFSPFWGLMADVVGMLTVFGTQYLCVGAVVIPAAFTAACFFFYPPEAGLVSLFLTLLMFNRHWSALRMVPSGHADRTDVIGAIRKKIRQ